MACVIAHFVPTRSLCQLRQIARAVTVRALRAIHTTNGACADQCDALRALQAARCNRFLRGEQGEQNRARGVVILSGPLHRCFQLDIGGRYFAENEIGKTEVLDA